MSRRLSLAGLAVAAALAACTDRSSSGPTDPNVAAEAARGPSASRASQERLARSLALALAEPGFRAYVKDALDRSTLREHKLQFQRFLGRGEGRARAALARAGAQSDSSVDRDARGTIALEMYFPVAAHRAAWRGDQDLLVATARDDGETPVAFDIHGRRRLLDPKNPPPTPVLAVVPVEADYSADSVGLMLPTDATGGGGGGGSSAPPPGLYMSSAHFVQDFEGWLKGDPEFEIHILGQSGASDSLMSYQCAGAQAGGYYKFDQNNLDWSGSVLLFSQVQLTNYKSAHPNQNVRIMVLEDDDGACQIRLDGDRFKNFQNVLQTNYPKMTGGKDSTSGLSKVFKRADALQRILKAAYSWITSQDDLVGNALEDSVVNEWHSGSNWIVRGENNTTNGWLNLQMR